MADNIVEVEALVKVYEPSHVRAVDGISFGVERGEIFGFLGPNGAGKSTTIKILTTLLRKTSGRANVDGMDVDRDGAAIRRVIGYAAQDVSVDDDLTARENLRLQAHFYHLPPGDVDRRVNELLHAVDLAEPADRRAGTYSGGMRKRLDLATGLIHKPKVLFLDEPTTGLDPQSRRAMWDYIRSLNDEGTTIFLTTQYMEEADHLAHRLLILDGGKVVTEGTTGQLKAEIGADVIRIALPDNGNNGVRDAAVAALRGLPTIRETQAWEEGVVAYADSGPATIPQIVRRLDEAHVGIRELTFSAPSLDDVFLKHTGRKMRVEEVRPPSRMMWGARRRRRM